MKILILNNFLQNPNLFIDLASKISFRKRSHFEYFEGVRSNPLHEIDKEVHAKICNEIIFNYFGNYNFEYNASVFLHKTYKTDTLDTQWINDKIHQDNAILAGIIFLSPNAPIDAGTQTYKNIEGTFYPDVVMGNEFNRLILYPANEFHSATNFFGDEKNSRLVLLFFLNQIATIIHRQ